MVGRIPRTASRKARPGDFADLLQIEDSDELVSFRCQRTGIPAWTAIRQPVLRLFGIASLYEGRLVETNYRFFSSASAKMAVLARAIHHNQTFLGGGYTQVPVTVSATGTGLLWQDRRYFNRLGDHFCLAENERSGLLEDLCEWKWPFPRANEKVTFRAPIQAWAAVQGRLLAPAYRRTAAPFVDMVLSRAERLTGVEVDAGIRRWLTWVSAIWLASAPYQVDAYRRLYKCLGTRLLLKEEGCYGHAAPMIVAARDLGIVTAEFQHGLVSSGHDAYNFAPVVASSPSYRRTLPDYFLSYGRWWQEQINAPLEKAVIGNPHRDQTLRGWSSGTRTDILVLGDAIDRDFYCNFCLRLKADLPNNVRVVFRPHPIERSQFDEESERARWRGVEIDDQPDIYGAFATAAAVVGEMSTGLFEAAGLVRQIYVLDTVKSRFAMPSHPFARISDADDLRRQFVSHDGGTEAFDAEEIWASNWQLRYRNFVDSALG